MNIVTFAGTECHVSFKTYAGGNVRINLIDCEDGFPFATATCDLGILLPAGAVAVKDWSENQGMVEALQDAGIIGDCVDCVPSGYVTVGIYELLVELPCRGCGYPKEICICHLDR